MFFIPGGRKRLEELASGQESSRVGTSFYFFVHVIIRRPTSNVVQALTRQKSSFPLVAGKREKKSPGTDNQFLWWECVCLASWLAGWLAGAGVEQAPLDVLERSLATSPLAALPSIRRHPFYFLFFFGNYFHFPGLWRNLLSIKKSFLGRRYVIDYFCHFPVLFCFVFFFSFVLFSFRCYS